MKTICSFIGAQAMIDTEKHGGRNPLVELAASLHIIPTEEDRELERIRGPQVAASIEDDPRFARVAADPATGQEAANGAGSFESLLGMFGASGAAAGAPLPG